MNGESKSPFQIWRGLLTKDVDRRIAVKEGLKPYISMGPQVSVSSACPHWEPLSKTRWLSLLIRASGRQEEE